MGTVSVSVVGSRSGMLQFVLASLLVGVVLGAPEADPGLGPYHHGYGPHGCHKELETIKVKGERLTYDRECKEIEVDVCAHGYHGHHGYHRGRREADPHGPVHVPACKNVTKKVCKPVPVKTPVEKEIETCVEIPVEVCEDVDKVVPKVTCEHLKIH